MSRAKPIIVVVVLILAIAGVVAARWRISQSDCIGPPTGGTINDLSTDAVAVLRSMKRVASVDVTPAKGKLNGRVIHLLDWHFVDRDLFAIDFRNATGKELMEGDWQQFLADIETVQGENATILEALATSHGLKRVLVERLTAGEMAEVSERVKMLDSVSQEAQERTRKQLADVREMLKAETPGTERHNKLTGIESELVERQDTLRQEWLRLGSAFKVRALEVLPLDDAGLLAAANPLKAAPGVIDNRRDAMIRNAMAVGPVVVIVCGGSHDLGGTIKRVAGDGVEYLRVSGKAYSSGK